VPVGVRVARVEHELEGEGRATDGRLSLGEVHVREAERLDRLPD